MSDPVLVLLAIGATARLTGLVLDDTITAPVRNRALVKLDTKAETSGLAAWLLGLATCRWCVSVWVGAVVAVLAYYLGDTPPVAIALLALSASQATGMLGSVGRD